MRADSGRFGIAVAAAAVVAALAISGAAQSNRRASVLKITGAEPRAVVFVDGIRQGRTNDSGAQTIETIPPGRYTVVVRQPGYADYKEPVALMASRPVTVMPKRVPVKDPAELAFQRAEGLALDGKAAEAVAGFQEAVEARGGAYPEAQIGLARALLTLKKTDEATAAVAAVIDADPKNLEAHTVLGMVLRERGLYDEAASEFRKAVALAPSRSPDAHAGLALALEDTGDRTQAVAEFRKAIAQNLDSEPLLYQLLGAALERLDRPKEAIAAYERFIALAPSHSLAPAVRSILERLKEKPAESDDGDVNPYAPKP